MRTHLIRLATIMLLVPGLVACVSDKMVTLRSAPDPGVERLTGGRAVTVFRFADRRGDEGDGDPRRVGGLYGAYGNRVAKVFATTPWPEALVQDLAAALTARGVEAVRIPDREYGPGPSAISTPLALGGEIRNFSVDARWTLQAHVSGVIRLYNQQGALLLEKPLSVRMPRDDGGSVREPGDRFENLLNAAVREFVRKVVTDVELTQQLVATGA